MAYSDKNQLRDAAGNLLVDQHYDSGTDEFVPGTGGGGGGGGGDASAANQLATQGTVAPGTAAVKSNLVGAVFTNPPATVTAGQQVALQVDSRGNLKTQMVGVGTNGADGIANTVAFTIGNLDATGSNRLLVMGAHNFNGSTWDRQRGNTKGTFTVASPLTGTDRSAAASTTSTSLMAANATRARYTIQNNTTTDLWIAYGVAAVVGGVSSMKIPIGQSYFGEGDVEQVFMISAGTPTGNVFAREW